MEEKISFGRKKRTLKKTAFPRKKGGPLKKRTNLKGPQQIREKNTRKKTERECGEGKELQRWGFKERKSQKDMTPQKGR